LLAHCQRQPYGLARGVIGRQWVVEVHRQAIRHEWPNRALELVDHTAEGLVVLAQHSKHFLGRRRVSQGRKTWEVTAHNSNLPPMALEQRLTLRRHEQLRDLRRQKASQAA